MRPFPGDGPPPRRNPRGADNEPPTAFHHPASGQQQITSYFIGGEDAVDAALQQSLASFTTSFTTGGRDHRKAGSADPESANPAKHTAHSDRESISTSDPADADDISLMSDIAPSRLNLPGSTSNLSQPITPLMLATPGSPSAISDAMSASFSEEIASQALSMSQDLEPMEASEMMDSGSAPQLVMPSIKMPSRRPFTDGGRRIGRLKVLVAGDSGAYRDVTAGYATPC